MARLNLANGLFKVTDRLYQLRGFDISNMTVIEGDTGVILIDPLTTAEVARAALAHYFAHRPHEAGRGGDLHPQPHRPLWRRARRDRRGRRQGGQGRRSSRPTASWRRSRARTCWPACRWRAARSSSSAPCCRAAPRGQVDAGLGKSVARGTPGLIAPTRSIVQPVEEHTIDGVRIVFQLAPETEAPAEMHMFYPRARRAQHGRERLPAAAQLHPAARRRGARSAHLGQVHRRRHRAVRAGHRHPDRPAPLADLGRRRGARSSRGAARPLQAHPRPDPALHEQGLAAGRDRRGDRPAAGPRRALVGARLLRLGQPQREGGLPALSQLVRRQPLQPPPAAAGAGGRASSSNTWAAPRRSSRARAPTSPRASTAGWRR